MRLSDFGVLTFGREERVATAAIKPYLPEGGEGVYVSRFMVIGRFNIPGMLGITRSVGKEGRTIKASIKLTAWSEGALASEKL